MRQPRRRAVEPGVYIRVNEAGERVGDTYETAWKDAQRRSQRRGGFRTLEDARRALRKAKVKRDEGEREPTSTKLTFAAAAERWQQSDVARLRPRRRRCTGRRSRTCSRSSGGEG